MSALAASARALVEAADSKPTAHLLGYQRDAIEQAREVVACVDHEVRQTQRRMIAALYWLAGEALLKERAAHTKWIVAQDRGERARHARVADNFGHVQDALETAASAMEAAL